MIVVNTRNHWVKSAVFKDAVWDFHNFGLCNFFLVMFIVEIQLLNLKGLKKLDFIKCPEFFDATNQRRDISTDQIKKSRL